jgi:hypothetical protein
MPLTAGYRIYLHGSYSNETPLSASARCRWQTIGGRQSLVLSLLLGVFAAALIPLAYAQPAPQQAPPQMLPYVNNIYAGSGVQYATPVTPKGSTTTPVHGSAPGDGGPATASGVQLNGPTHIAVDSLGNVYFTDSSGPVRKVDTNGNITTFAAGLASGAGDCAASPTNTIGDGCAANETDMKSPYGIAIDPASGDIYISENTGARIRKISHSTYLASSVVDVAGTKGGLDGDLTTCSTTPGVTCSGTAGTVSGPRGLAVDKHGNLYIMDEGNFAVRLANFVTGQLTTIVNTAKVKATTTTCGTDAAAGGVTASSASLGVAGAIAFDSADNLYITDSTCNYVFKVAEDPATGMVDGNSILTVVMGNGQSTTQTTFTNQLGTSVSFTPAGVVADPLGNLYVGESTGDHVWFWDHATGYMHTVFGGGTAGNCYGIVGSGTSPYNGCDGNDSALAATKGTGGLALDAWGNLYIADSAAFYVHKLSIGTNAPPSTSPPNQNALLHVGANDTYASVSTVLAPDFTFVVQNCAVNSQSATPAGDNTQDCDVFVTNTNPSSSPQYEQVTVTSAAGLNSVVPLTNQAFPTCQGATAISQSVLVQGASTPVTLSFQPGDACTAAEGVALAPHKYSYTVVGQPAHGTLSGAAPALIYAPNAGFTGSDSFTFSLTDNSTFAPATIPYDGSSSSIVMETPAPLVGSIGTITLQPYSPPVATPQSVTVPFNTSQTITLTGTDSNGAKLTFSAPSTTAHGTLTGAAPNLTYTPAASYFGPDSFTFTVNDGVSTSVAATIAITVNPAPPTPSNPTVSVNFQTATAITLSATGQGPITYAVTAQPANGTLSGTAPNLTYTPGITYSGPDSFTYTATNAGGASTGTVSITVGQPPLIPTPQPSSATVPFNIATPISVIAGGGNGHALTYILVTAPIHGTLSAFTGPVATYTPASGYIGPDSFTFKVTDGTTTGPTAATVSITVVPPAPVANSQSVTTAFATPVSVTLVATGAPPITYAVVTPPAHGTLSGTAPNLTYTPSNSFAGADSFTFKANNGSDSNIATVSITVTAPSAPVASSQSVTVNYQTGTPVTLSATGLGTLNYTVTIAPTHGTLSGSAPNLTYTPAAGYSGSDSLSFTATNPGGTSAAAVVSITVLSPAPVAQSQMVTDTYNGTLPITLAATGNGTLTYAVTASPAHGTLTLSGAVATYTPIANYIGSDSFNFTASNGSVSNAATIAITVLPPPPVASNLSATANYNTPVTIQLPSGVTDAIVAQPTNGTVTVAGTTATYTPATNFAGTDSFTFTESNAGGTSNVATATIAVSGGFTWSAASSEALTATVTNGQTATYNLLVSGWTNSSGVTVALACTGAPIACNVTPNPATLKGTTAVPVTVTVSTLTTTAAPLGLTWVSGSGAGRTWLLMLNLVWLALIVPLARKHRTIYRTLVAIGALAIFASVSGCGGNIPEQAFGTPPGTYTFSVTASATGAMSTAQSITLIVN